MMSVETLYEMRDTAPVIVGSVTELPVDGMPYHLNLAPFFNTGTADVVQAAKNTFEYFNSKTNAIDRTCTMSVVNTHFLEEIGQICAEIFLTLPKPVRPISYLSATAPT